MPAAPQEGRSRLADQQEAAGAESARAKVDIQPLMLEVSQEGAERSEGSGSRQLLSIRKGRGTPLQDLDLGSSDPFGIQSRHALTENRKSC